MACLRVLPIIPMSVFQRFDALNQVAVKNLPAEPTKLKNPIFTASEPVATCVLQHTCHTKGSECVRIVFLLITTTNSRLQRKPTLAI
jgi:hypothetical protein